MSLLRSRIAVIDTETTGFESNPLASVIDVAGIILDTDGSEIACFDSLVRPMAWGEWTEGASKIHGIQLADVQGAPLPGAVAADLEAWLADNDCQWVTSFNVGFDRPMLARMGLHGWLPGDRGGDLRFGWAACIMLRAANIMGSAGVLRDADPRYPRFIPDLPWLFPPLCPNGKGGVSACEFFGVEPVLPAHRAKADAATAVKVLLATLPRYPVSPS